MSGALAVFQHSGFRLYVFARVLLVSAGQILSVAIGWQVYELTHSALMLGYVGLAEFLPNLVFSFLTGTVADRLDRRKIMMASIAASAAAAGLLAWQAARPRPQLEAFFVVAGLLGVIRAFSAPAGTALLPSLVPAEHFPSAVAWQMIAFQAAVAVGPAAGGLVLDRSPLALYLGCAGLYGGAFAAYFAISVRPVAREGAEPIRKALVAGLRFTWREKVILGAMSLDLFAVLLGGATALLPIYAGEILKTGPTGLGFLRGAPALGAGLAALVLAVRPLRERAGGRLLVSVWIFGGATIVFGLSEWLPLSVAALAVAGAADMVSVVVRHTLIQVATPDSMRGRVSAVSFIFIGASNQLGEFRAGVMAALLGTVPAVVAGGAGTCLVVLLWLVLFPSLRRLDRLS
jgi:MFS family permease